MLKIYLARHGQDSDNIRRVLNGHRDTSLTIIGQQQALQLAKRIKSMGLCFNKIYTSPLLRVQQTAKIVTDYLSLPEAEILPDLIERDFGKMTGMTIDDILLLENNNIVQTPEVSYFLEVEGAENFSELIARSQRVLNLVERENEDGNVLLLTSGDIGKMIYTAYHEKTWEEVLPSFYFSNTDLRVLEKNLPLEKSLIFKNNGIFNRTLLGMSEKSDGDMKENDYNKKNFLKEVNLDKKTLFSADLEHGNKVIVIKDLQQKIESKCDALITDQPDCLLTITAADCPSLYFYDSQKKVIALAHAGWRGIIRGIIEATILSFKDNYNSNPEDIEVFIGPYIRSCHFEIKKDVVDNFSEEDLIKRNEKIYIDLGELIKKRLLKQGIKIDNINISKDCTYCLDNKYFSFRRNGGKNMETMLAYLALK